MSSLNLISPAMGGKYQAASNPPTAVSSLYRVGDKWTHTTTGEIFTCYRTDATGVAWSGTQGTRLEPDITAFDHPDLLFAYTMDNISGSTLVDESPNGKDGSIVATMTSIAGKLNNALESDNSTGHVQTPLVESLSGGFCFSAWCNIPDLNDDPVFIAKRDGGAGNDFQVYMPTATRIDALLWGASPLTNSFTVAVSANTWFLLIVNFDNTNINLWINDGKQTLGCTGPIDNTSSNIRLFNDWFAGFSGLRMDQVRLFNRALTDSEAAALYNGGVGA